MLKSMLAMEVKDVSKHFLNLITDVTVGRFLGRFKHLHMFESRNGWVLLGGMLSGRQNQVVSQGKKTTTLSNDS